MSCTALLRATLWSHSQGAPCMFCSPSLHHGLRYVAGESPMGSPSPCLPCPLHSQGSSAGRSLALEGPSQTPAPPAGRARAGHPRPGTLPPSTTYEESSQSMALFSRQLLPAPARNVFVLPLLWAPHQALVVISPECHRSDIATI